jgi:signal transduction histidine kinase
LAEALARTLRHEIGDFLQKVYASVAILQGRLPAQWDLERDILARLRHGAEGCKRLVDAIQDFLCPLTVTPQAVNLAILTAPLVTAAQAASPHLQITLDAADPAPVAGDPDRLIQVGRALLTNACEAARERVQVRLRTDAAAQQVEWTFQDDGPGIAPELAERLFRPFFTTRAGHAGLGLALVRKIVSAHQGSVTAGNGSDGGFRAQVLLPGPEKVLAGSAALG